MRSLVLSSAILAGTVGVASAATTGFDLSFNGNGNTPRMELTNTSDTAKIEFFSFFIGDTAYNFDAIYNFTTNPFVGGSSFVPDMDDSGGDRSDFASGEFSDFDAGESFGFMVDIDLDDVNSTENYRNVLAMGGYFDVGFDSGDVFTLSFDENSFGPGNNSFSVFDDDTAAVPLPAGLPLLAGALGIFGLVRRRKG